MYHNGANTTVMHRNVFSVKTV